MTNLDSSVRVVGVCPEVTEYFNLRLGQLFRLEQDTIFFAGDYVFVAHAGNRLFALVCAGGFRTTEGDLGRHECRVLARAIPQE